MTTWDWTLSVERLTSRVCGVLDRIPELEDKPDELEHTSKKYREKYMIETCTNCTTINDQIFKLQAEMKEKKAKSMV